MKRRFLTPTDPTPVVREWVKEWRPDMVAQMEPILSGNLPAPQRDAFMLLVAVGFHAGREFEALSERQAYVALAAIGVASNESWPGEVVAPTEAELKQLVDKLVDHRGPV